MNYYKSSENICPASLKDKILTFLIKYATF